MNTHPVMLLLDWVDQIGDLIDVRRRDADEFAAAGLLALDSRLTQLSIDLYSDEELLDEDRVFLHQLACQLALWEDIHVDGFGSWKSVAASDLLALAECDEL